MILTSDITTKLKALLDAEDSERYTWTQDFKPAIDMGIDYIVSVFNRGFGQNKLSEDSLRELIRRRLYVPSIYNRIQFDGGSTNDKLWTIIGVYPEAVSTPVTSPGSSTENSLLKSSISYESSNYSAKRLTSEEWNESKNNPFIAGNNIATCSDVKTYAYRSASDYQGYSAITSNQEIEIRPSVSGTFVAIEYLRLPVKPTSESSNIELPNFLQDFLVDRSLQYISFKEGDGTNLYSVTDRDVQTFINLMS